MNPPRPVPSRVKLRESDRRLLALLGTDTRPVAALADAGDAADRVDTSPEVETALDALGLGPDETDAVRKSFAFLRYWGRVTAEEVADAVFPEAPAGRETPTAWWEGLVRDSLSTLPDVVAPTTPDGEWRYANPAEADDGADGRRVLSKLHPVYGDVRHAVASLDLTDAEREAARAAFTVLYRRESVTERDVSDAVYADHPAGYPSPDAWWGGFLRATFDALPGVERVDGAWRYRRP